MKHILDSESVGRHAYDSNKWKRDIASKYLKIDNSCVNCSMCVHQCPHAALRMFNISEYDYVKLSADIKSDNDKLVNGSYRCLGYSPADCTGCGECIKVCKVGNISMVSRSIYNQEEKELLQKRFNTLYNLVEGKTRKPTNLIELACAEPYFEFSGACAGCGETKFLTMLSKIFQDGLVVINATGCSSIYGGTVPYLPWKCSWVSSLFEDAAEVGLGVKLSDTDNSKSVWVIMGDGAAYDIGFNGLDHVCSQSNININFLILDNGQYSNTGGQASKATPKDEKHGLQSEGKITFKKDILGALKGAYNDRINICEIDISEPIKCLNAFKQAQEFNGPSVVLAKCHCIMNKYHKDS